MELAKLWINDQEVETKARFETLNPATGESIAKVCAAGPDEVRAAVDAARAAFPAWSALSPQERCRYLLAARDVLIAGIDDVVALITREQGKPNVEALTSEVLSVIDTLAYYAEHAPQFLAPEEVAFHQSHLMGRKGQIVYEPLSVVGIISPWNMPFLLPMIPVITALAAGNTVVLKPSEFTPLIGLKIAEIFQSGPAIWRAQRDPRRWAHWRGAGLRPRRGPHRLHRQRRHRQAHRRSLRRTLAPLHPGTGRHRPADRAG